VNVHKHKEDEFFIHIGDQKNKHYEKNDIKKKKMIHHPKSCFFKVYFFALNFLFFSFDAMLENNEIDLILKSNISFVFVDIHIAITYRKGSLDHLAKKSYTNLDKSTFGVAPIDHLGSIISLEGVGVALQKIEAI
jgi:hypothetical protein